MVQVFNSQLLWNVFCIGANFCWCWYLGQICTKIGANLAKNEYALTASSSGAFWDEFSKHKKAPLMPD